MSDLEKILCTESRSEALIGHMGGGRAGSAGEQFERADPEGIAGEIWAALQTLAQKGIRQWLSFYYLLPLWIMEINTQILEPMDLSSHPI